MLSAHKLDAQHLQTAPLAKNTQSQCAVCRGTLNAPGYISNAWLWHSLFPTAAHVPQPGTAAAAAAAAAAAVHAEETFSTLGDSHIGLVSLKSRRQQHQVDAAHFWPRQQSASSPNPPLEATNF
jgi:hypothetical protein